MNRILFSSADQNWKTPVDVYAALNAEFNFDCDPCPPDALLDGLMQEWGQCSFVNPPYSRVGQWVAKSYDSWCEGKTVVLLIPARTDTIWFHKFILPHAEIRFIKGRLKFGGAKNSAPFPSMIVVFRAKAVSV